MPDDRPIDGIDQSDLLLGRNDNGRCEHLLTFVGPDLVAARWKQFRAYFADVAPGRSGEGGAALMGGVGSSAAPMTATRRSSISNPTRARSTILARCITGCLGRS